MAGILIAQQSMVRAQLPWWPMWLGLFMLLAIVVYDLGINLWLQGQSDYGPLVLIIASWVLYKQRGSILAPRTTTSPRLASLVLLAGLVMFVIGRSQQILFFEASGWVLALVACLLAYGGWPAIKASAFALLLLTMFVPHPAFVVDTLTAELKVYVSIITELSLYTLGYPIGRNGVILTIGGYQMLVADACSGMRSIFSLTTIGLLYLYISRHKDLWRNAVIVACIVPIAVLANAVRVITLVLITYHFGDDAGQGFAHTFAHVLLFLAAVALLAGLDRLLGWLAGSRFRRGAPAC